MGIHGSAQNSQPAPADDLFSGGWIILRDNLLVDHYEDPYPPGLYRYETNRYPYIEVEHNGDLFHAQAHGWKSGILMITRIKNQLGRVDNGAKETFWVPATACTRIRSEDSTWVTTEDDHHWHADQDKTIGYRADPSLVYKGRGA